MPVMDGWQAINLIRKELEYEGLVIAYTAYSHKNDIKKCKDLGFDFVLNKPATPKQVLDVMADVWPANFN